MNGAAVVVGGVRSAFGRLGGALADYDSHDLAAAVIRALLQRAEVPAEHVEELILGVGLISSGTMVPARRALFAAGLPARTPSLTVDRACCSGAVAVVLAAQKIEVGERSLALAGGMESMSRTPLLLRAPRGGRRQTGDLLAEDILLMRSPLTDGPIARYVGEEALDRGVDRLAQDEWAHASHQRYFAAWDRGLFADELVPLPGRSGEPLAVDEQARRATSLDALSNLATVYGSPTITAGNAPGLNDGAAVLLLASPERARADGLQPLGRILGTVSLSDSPTSSAWLPAHAILQVLESAGRKVKDLATIEINEAFAATAAVSVGVLADGDAKLRDWLAERTNPNGGAVAVGHPVGASGARITLTALLELRRRGGGLGVAAICGGFGQADAILFESV
jgi:acetyl-CoA C-acetyltransferase